MGDTLVNVENKIFALTKKIGRYVQAGDIEEVTRLQRQIAQLQRKYGATKGHGRDENNEPTT